MSLQTLDDSEMPGARGGLATFMPAVLMLAAIAVIGGWWLLRDDGTPRGPAAPAAAEQTVTVPLELATGREKGGLAELEDDRTRAAAAGTAPYVVYLVTSAEQLLAIGELELAAGEVILIAGTPEEMAAAEIHIALLEMGDAMASSSRHAVRIIDLRAP